ncbi:DUF1667 domain-containing protein [Murdochiella massiliensis]|uniref:DUF1667 domain-containing protein n=1 Tax=Murdochiella massiliensis TaxID=1673723 RepID=UPI00082CE8A4|nr:DUF1667 domain-containing protein [Murdochiella massiliensis]
MTKREMVCIVCPMGCTLTIEQKSEALLVTGNRCPRGEQYAKQELTAPLRNIASTVRVHNGVLPVVPVKTDREIPKEKIFAAMALINAVEVEAPVRCGECIIPHLFGTEANIVATRDLAACDSADNETSTN